MSGTANIFPRKELQSAWSRALNDWSDDGLADLIYLTDRILDDDENDSLEEESEEDRARMFDRWLAEHDRQVAEKAYQEGYTSGWYRGWEDDGDHICHDNPYRRDGL